MRLLLRIMLLLLAPTFAAAAPPSDLGDFAYLQKPGSQLPLQAMFLEGGSHSVKLLELLHGEPLVLALGYYHCPNLCGVVRADLFAALQKTAMTAGRDYSLIALSIDPSETGADAQAAKADDLSHFGSPGAESGWHFLVGSVSAVQSVSKAVGFRSRFDPELKQFLHPAGIVFITPAGVVSSYLLGVGYTAADVKMGVMRAKRGVVAAAASPILLLCFHYDPKTGKYTLAVMKLMRLAGLITVATIAGTLFLALRRDRSRA